MVGRIGLGLGVLLAASSLVACGESAGDEAEAARARWREQSLSSYVFVVSKTCQCFGIGETRVVVEEGLVVEAVSMSSGLSYLEGAQTMDELMDDVVEQAHRDNHKFEANYSEKLGYVTSLSVDQSERGADDELELRVTCLGEGTGVDVCPLTTVDESECPGEAIEVPAEWGPGQRLCAKGALPSGRITGSELVCCPTAGVYTCAELEELVLAELPKLQACEQEDDCGSAPLQDCRYAVGVTSDMTELLSLMADSTEQECSLDLGDECTPLGIPTCEAGRCRIQ